MGYPTIGSEGQVTSWGSANINATILAAITSHTAVLTIDGDPQDITGLATSQTSRIPGLKSATVRISAMIGSTPYLGNRGFVTYNTGGYALHVYDWTWTATSQVHDITEFSSSSSPNWMSFRPDVFYATASYTAGIDSSTALVLPPDPGASLNAITLSSLSNGSGTSTADLSATGVLARLTGNIRKYQKDLATYEINGTGAWTAAGASSIFGSRTFANASNADPLWNAGGSATGALVFRSTTGRTYTCADSFWRQIRIRAGVAQVSQIDIDIQVSGAVTVA